MLKAITDLKGFGIHAKDGDLGHIEDFYFDDEKWTLRYLVVRTGSWLFGKHVLTSPLSIDHIDWESRKLCVNLTMEQVKNSPDIDTAKPISRQKESEFHLYYNIPTYWGGMGLWAHEMSPQALSEQQDENVNKNLEPEKEEGNSHLRSVKEVIGYSVHSIDGEAGHVENFIFDDEKWAVRYMVVHSKKLLHGAQVLISPKWVDRVIWARTKVNVNTSMEKIKHVPPFDPEKEITRNYEEILFDYYEMHKYWDEEEELNGQ